MSDRRVLFIVEGARGEPRFLRRMHTVLFGTKPENIHVHGTTVHGLLRSMFPNGTIDRDLDVVSILREGTDGEERSVLEAEYSDVYLVFDMDPQDQRFNPVLLREAVRYFDDSTDRGKLYLNYPMLESYRHVTCPGDQGFLERTVSMDDIPSYKAIVGSECHPDYRDISRYDARMFTDVIILNLRKVDMMLGGDGRIPSRETFLEWSGEEIFDAQLHEMSEHGRIHVLNTSLFNPVDFNPGMFLGM